MTDLVSEAWQRRQKLHDLDAYRVLHGWQEGMPGVEIDRYGDAAIIAHKASAAADTEALASALMQLHPFDVIVAKPRNGSPFALRGELNSKPRIVRELDMSFAIEPAQPRNPGLYLDARPARAWIREHSHGRRVLNLFAFTGSLGVTAAVGGARSVTHVDGQRGALARCKANHDLNNVPIDDRDLLRGDVYQMLRKAGKRRRTYDAIIVDAPPYVELAAKQKATGLLTLGKLTAPLLAPDGWLLCFFHHSELDHDRHERELREAAGVDLDVCWRGTSGIDFPEQDPRKKLRLSAFRRPS